MKSPHKIKMAVTPIEALQMAHQYDQIRSLSPKKNLNKTFVQDISNYITNLIAQPKSPTFVDFTKPSELNPERPFTRGDHSMNLHTGNDTNRKWDRIESKEHTECLHEITDFDQEEDDFMINDEREE